MTIWKSPNYFFINVLIDSLENCQALHWTTSKMKRIIPTLKYLAYFLNHMLKISHKLYLQEKKLF